MPTATASPPIRAASFVLRSLCWSLGLFGLLRLPWVEAHFVLPLVGLQAGLALRVFGVPPLPVDATLACSGADALALCTGAVLAYPVAWRRRLAGAAAGLVLILALNTARIGTLGRAVSSPWWFHALHLYIWPAALTLAIAGFVFAWMRVGEARSHPDGSIPAAAPPLARPSRRFVLLTFAFVLAFSAVSPLYLESAGVLAVAGFIARAAAAILGGFGVTAHAAANVLWTPRGGFAVTQECIATPLIPVYLAAVCAYAASWRRLALGVLATLPLFAALGIVRLLTVAVPGTLASPLFLVHAFYQLLLGAVVVYLAALWRHERRLAPAYALAGILAGGLFVYLLGPVYTRAIAFDVRDPLADPQGALALLPSFQVGLYLALSVAAFAAVGWTRFLAGLAALAVTQTAGVVVLGALTRYPDFAVHVRDIRGWAIAGPVLVFMAAVTIAPARR